MDDFIQRLTAILKSHFPDGAIEIEPAGPVRAGGALVWEGFSDREQIDRQRELWKVLRQELSIEDQGRISTLLTFTPEEMAIVREG